MNKREKEVLQASLDNERSMLEQIEQNYINALADIKKKIKKLQEMPDTQSRAYQIDFQKQLEAQVNTYIDILQMGNIETIEDYLNLCYETGFIGNMYQLQGYDVNIVAPINQNVVVNATKMTADGVKLSKKIAGDTELLKNQVVQEIQRGFSVAMSYADIARNISARGQASMNRSLRIARTEGNRVHNEAAYDSAKEAANAGVDTVKQWVAVLDARTRDSHQTVDGEWVELDKKFSNGLFMPGDRNAPAAEIVNCRCKAAFVPRWLVESNTPRLRRDNITGDIIECKNYAEFREKYLNSASDNGILNNRYGFKVINGKHSRNNDLSATNPNYSTGKPEWTRNCQRCVSTYEARIRGYDVTAKPRILNGTDRLPIMRDRQNGWTSVYKNPMLKCVAAPTNDECKKLVEYTMSQYGDGARAIVRVKWSSGGGHVFFAEQKSGKTIFVDPQTNDTDCSYYFKAISSNETYLLRVDNLDFTDKIKECCQ